MKKILPVLIALLMVLFSLQSQAETADPYQDPALRGYISQLLGYGPRARGTTGSRLTGVQKIMYDGLRAKVEKVAAGEIEDTVFTFELSDMGSEYFVWTLEELGLASADDPTLGNVAFKAALGAIKVGTVVDYLLEDLPYDMYWYCKSKKDGYGGNKTGVSGYYSIDGDTVSLEGTVTVSMSVAKAYAKSEYVFDTSLITGVQNAVRTAKGIVAAQADKGDYEKLTAYRDSIRSMVTYNYDAAGDKTTPYGDPWQLIYVFDGDPDTKVVCEGYSKAFQYLCDLTSFRGNVSCICVSGNMTGGTGAGNHMWNIVRMSDGKNYLVDVTNWVERDNDLFFDGFTSGSVENGYIYKFGSGTISYAYGTDTKDMFSASELEMASARYDPTANILTFTVSYDAAGGTGAPAAQVKTEEVDLTLSTAVPARSHKLLLSGEGGNQEITRRATFTGWNTAADGTGTAYAAGGTYAGNANVTLYAQWTFGTAGDLPAAEKNGYTFDGWYTAADGGEQVLADTQVTADMTLYPHFTKIPETYAVSYNTAGGTGVPDNQVKTEDVDLVLSSTVPTRSHKLTLSGEGGNQEISVAASFTGWNTAADGSGTAYAAGGTYTENAAITLYAQWTLGTAGELPAAEKEGFTFDGWFTALEGGDQVLATTTVSSDMTLYPHFTRIPETYAVSYNAAGGIGAPDNQVKTEDVDLTLSTTVPSRSHKLTLAGEGGNQEISVTATFTGWNSAEDGSGTAYAAGGTYTGNAAITLYAQWTFGTAGELPEAEKEGFTFDGWFTAADGGEQILATTRVTADLTLYPHFTKIPETYTVSYNAAGGTGAPADQVKTEDVALLLSTTVPVRSHRLTLSGEGEDQEITVNATFSGWNTAENGSGTAYRAGGTYTGNADVTLYAQWTFGTAGELPAPTKEGFDFNGWYTAPEGGEKVESGTQVSSDQTLYPRFTEKIHGTFTVSFNAAGGTGAPENQVKTEDVDLLLSTTVPVRSHKLILSGEGENQEITVAAAFTGWNTLQDGSGTAYAAGGTYSANADVMLYAQWTFGTAGELPAAEKDGYTFDGWFTAADGGEQVLATAAVTTDMTLYPHFTKIPETYTVSYNAAGGTGAPESQVKTEDVDLTLSTAVPVRSHKLTLVKGEGEENQEITKDAAFSGWNTAEDGTGTAYSAGGTYTGNSAVTLYAQWTFGTAGELPEAEKEGFTFDGWYTAADGGDRVESATRVTADMTLYPHFTKIPETYTVSYNAAGGTGAPDSQTKTEDVDLTLSTAVPVRSHKLTLVKGEGEENQEITKDATFTGWNTAEDGTGTAYSAGGTYTGNAAVTLYAQWTFGTAGELPALTKEGFDFSGWYTAPEGGEKVESGTQVSADLTLYPRFTEKVPGTFTVSFNAAGGIGAPENQTKTENVDLTLSTTVPVRSYVLTLSGEGGNREITIAAVFTGWNTAEDGNGTAYSAGGTYTLNADVTLYAQWTYGTAGELPEAEKEGYTFDGWFTAAEDGEQILATTAVTADMTLYPHFTKIPGTWTVSYSAAGGTGAPDSQTKTEDVDLLLSTTVPVRSHKLILVKGEVEENQEITKDAAFTGWNTAEDGSGTAYSAGGTYTGNAAVTLYAQWTFGTAGELPAAEKDGYTFDGWFTAAEAGEQILADTRVTSDMTLYPHFTKNPPADRTWGEAEYTWSEDHLKVTARRVCETEPDLVETEEADAAVTITVPTEDTEGMAVYTSEAFENQAFEVQTYTVSIPALKDLKVLYLPEGTETIEEEAFEGCAFQAVILPDGVKTIEKGAFKACPDLIYAFIPSSVTDMAEDAFEKSVVLYVETEEARE